LRETLADRAESPCTALAQAQPVRNQEIDGEATDIALHGAIFEADGNGRQVGLDRKALIVAQMVIETFCEGQKVAGQDPLEHFLSFGFRQLLPAFVVALVEPQPGRFETVWMGLGGPAEGLFPAADVFFPQGDLALADVEVLQLEEQGSQRFASLVEAKDEGPATGDFVLDEGITVTEAAILAMIVEQVAAGEAGAEESAQFVTVPGWQAGVGKNDVGGLQGRDGGWFEVWRCWL